MKGVRNKFSRLRKAIFGLAATSSFMLLIEGGGRVYFHPGADQVFRVENSGGSKRYTFTLNEHRSACLVPKPPAVTRVLVFGESAANGIPYSPGGGFPAWLAAMADATGPSRKVEVINLGVNGANSTGIAAWFPQALDLDPDLVILYLGNNEASTFNRINSLDHPLISGARDFVARHSLVYQYIGATITRGELLLIPLGFYMMERNLDKVRMVETPRLRRRIDALFRANLESMLRTARERRIQAVVLSPAANLSGWPPPKSEHSSRFDSAATSRFDDLITRGKRELAAGTFAAAQDDFQAALDMDPDHAEANFRLGVAILEQGNRERALPFLQRARELEVPHFRAPYRLVELTRKTALESGAVWIDLDAELNHVGLKGAAGWDYFFDAVHFKDPGNYQAAAIILEHLRAMGLLAQGEKPLPSYETIRGTVPVSPRLRDAAEIQMGVFIGMFFKSPDLSEEAIRDFEQSRDPGGKVFQTIARAALHARLQQPEAAAEALTGLRRDDPRGLRAGAERFFPDSIEVYQDQGVFKIFPDTSLGRAGLTYMRFREDPAPRSFELNEFGEIPLAEASLCLTYDYRQNKFIDVTEWVRRTFRESAAGSTGGNSTRIDLMRPLLAVNANRMEIDWEHHLFRAISNDSYFVLSPLPADPLAFPILKIKATVQAEPPDPDNMVTIYWSGPGPLRFSEEKKITFAWPSDGKTRTREIPAGEIINLLLDRPISALRFDFSSAPAEIRIEEISLARKK